MPSAGCKLGLGSQSSGGWSDTLWGVLYIASQRGARMVNQVPIGRMRWSNIAASNALLAVMLILAAIALGDGARKALINSQDFQWSGARLLLHRQDPYKTFVKHVQGDPTASRSFILTQAPNYQV